LASKKSLQNFRKALKEITSGDYKPVYVISSKEKFFTDRLLTHFESVIPDEQRDFNFDLIYGRESTIDRIINIAQSYPMMAERRMIIVRDFMQLAEKPVAPGEEEEAGKGSLNDLIPYLTQPNPATILVLADTEKPNGRTKAGKALKKGKHTRYFQFDEIRDYEVPQWIVEWTEFKHDKKMEPGVAEKIAHSVGNNLLVLAAEIDKVCTYQKDKDIIDGEAVKNVIGTYKEYSVFDLKDAIVAHDSSKALYIADQILTISGNPKGEVFKTIGYFYSMFVKIWQIRGLAKKNKNKKLVQDEMGIGNSWYFNQLWEQAEAFGMKQIHLAFETLLDADRAMKGFGDMDHRGIFLMMVERLVEVER